MASCTVMEPYCGGGAMLCTACSYDGGLQGSRLSTCLNTSMAERGRVLRRTSPEGSASLCESSWRVSGTEFSFWLSFFRLFLLKAPKLLVLNRTLEATLMDCDRLFSSEIGLGTSNMPFVVTTGWLLLLSFLEHLGEPVGELVKTEFSDRLEEVLSRDEHEQSFPMYGSGSMFELPLSLGKDKTELAPPRLLSRKESSEICFFNGCSSKWSRCMEQSSWLLAWLHRLSRFSGRRRMGSEQRRLKGALLSNAASDCQDVVVMLGLRDEYEDDEPRPPSVDLLFSPASPSPSGSVLSYAESWWTEERESKWQKMETQLTQINKVSLSV